MDESRPFEVLRCYQVGSCGGVNAQNSDQIYRIFWNAYAAVSG